MKPAAGSVGEAGQARLPWTSWGTSPWWHVRRLHTSPASGLSPSANPRSEPGGPPWTSRAVSSADFCSRHGPLPSRVAMNGVRRQGRVSLGGPEHSPRTARGPSDQTDHGNVTAARPSARSLPRYELRHPLDIYRERFTRRALCKDRRRASKQGIYLVRTLCREGRPWGGPVCRWDSGCLSRPRPDLGHSPNPRRKAVKRGNFTLRLSVTCPSHLRALLAGGYRP